MSEHACEKSGCETGGGEWAKHHGIVEILLCARCRNLLGEWQWNERTSDAYERAWTAYEIALARLRGGDAAATADAQVAGDEVRVARRNLWGALRSWVKTPIEKPAAEPTP